MKFEAVLFDMDGVLVDSEYTMASAAIAALSEWGASAVHEDFVPYIGAGEDKFVGCVAEKYGLKYELEMKDRAYEIYGEMIEKHSIAFPNVKKVFETLKKSGVKMAVCSSADAVKVKYNLRSIGFDRDYFDAVLTGSDVKRKKPFPDIFLLAAKNVGAEPENCIVVEDAVNGILAAHNANMASFAVTTSFDRETLIEKTKPDYIGDDIIELLDIM
ncbi:MAG: HAD-IA family hydrolase [Clostridia bacterium]|nr:HAD-IA family hydrolase [Clostridia bacterium]